MDLKEHQFISYFEPEQAAQLCRLAIVENFHAQKIIFEEGEIPDFLYLILAGQVEFRKISPSEKYQTFALAKPNEFFGEFGVLDGQPRSAQAIVCGEATLAKIPRDSLMEILNNTKGRVVLKLLGYIVQQLRATTSQYVNQMIHQEKMALVGEMVNTIIHDFRSPVTGIHLASVMLKEQHPDEETIEWCDIIQAQVKRMLGMAEEALEFANGNALVNKEPVNLTLFVQHFEKLNRLYFKDSKVEFAFKATDVVANVDENKLMRVLQNLVGNAVEAFNGRGGRIEISAWAKDKWAELTISDNGPGIPEAIREKLFDPFVTYGKRGGTGLGTSIAKSIIEGHGGQISFQSNSDEGTTFYIRLPRINQ
ncbi:ATP-binding protein [Argonema antarcticum]|uniref:ATP-binding protein n=1 Tax=Argonema antarcticum TaxID=2942763 RepID=UPI0020134710|nr:ATP-binding protein [Argonema antarcticum]MCL1470888.1 cyclic nucleotide-binding domain-containing protein [Argonema antarcticum A004/B2]